MPGKEYSVEVAWWDRIYRRDQTLLVHTGAPSPICAVTRRGEGPPNRTAHQTTPAVCMAQGEDLMHKPSQQTLTHKGQPGLRRLCRKPFMSCCFYRNDQ